MNPTASPTVQNTSTSGGFWSDLNNGLSTFFNSAKQGIGLYQEMNQTTAQGTLEQGTANTLSTPNNPAGFTYQMGQALSSPFVWVLLAIVLGIWFLKG